MKASQHRPYKKSNILHQSKGSLGMKNIALLMGGLSRESEVSLSSGKGVEQSLMRLGYGVTSIDVGNDIAELLSELKPDVIFNALHGTFGEDGRIAGLLDLMQIPYTHSGASSSSICFDKVRTRQVLMSHGILMPNAKILSPQDLKGGEDPLPRPFVLKPSNEGSSVGVQIFFPEDNIGVTQYEGEKYNQIVAEEYIPGKEIQVAVFNDRAIGAIEIVPKNRFYDYTAKYSEGQALHLMPAPISDKAYKKVLQIAEDAHQLLGLKDISRSDFRYDDTKGEDGEFYLLEVNSHPGFTPLSLVPEIANYVGISYDEIVKTLVEKADYGQ